MAETKYTYSISNDTLNGKVDSSRLTDEIITSTITIGLAYINTEADVLDIWFKEALTVGEIATLTNLVSAHTGDPIEDKAAPISAQNIPLVEVSLYTGKAGSRGLSLVTPDLSDRTTWYQKSVQVTNETLTDSGDGLTFTSSHPFWVNIYSLKLTYTHKQIPKRDGTFGRHSDWATIVKVDNVIVSTGFSINYALGTITFTSSQAGKTITCTYWHNDGVVHPSEWLLVPPEGKKYIVEHTELQFSVGLIVTSPLQFEIWAGANLATYGTFPDYLFEAGYGQMRAEYRDAYDLLNAANLGQGVVSKFGSLTKEVIIIPFNYLQAFTLDSAFGVVFRLILAGDIPYTGCDFATGTFYVQLTT